MFLDSVWSWVLYRIVQSLLQLPATKEWKHWKTWSHCWCKTIITLTNRKKKLTDSQRKQKSCKVERFIGWINKMIWHETFSVFLANWTNTIKNCSEPFFFLEWAGKKWKILKSLYEGTKMLSGGFRESVERDIWTRVRESNEEGIRYRYSSRSLVFSWNSWRSLPRLWEHLEASGWQAKVGDDCLQSPWRYRSRPFKIVSLEPWVALLG